MQQAGWLQSRSGVQSVNKSQPSLIRSSCIVRYQQPNAQVQKNSSQPLQINECRNDWDEVILVSQNPDDVKQEIQRLKLENEKLKTQINQLGTNETETTIEAREEQQEREFYQQLDQQENALQSPYNFFHTQQTESDTDVRASIRRSQQLIQGAILSQARSNQSLDYCSKAVKEMNIVFVSAEVSPWSKTGGLGDVAGSLPVAMAQRGHRVMVISPRYMNGGNGDVWEKCEYLEQRVDVDMGECGVQNVGFLHKTSDGVDWVFVDHPCFHRQGSPYGDSHGAFADNLFRFSLLSLAALEATLQLKLQIQGQTGACAYGQQVMFVANDWHAAMVPLYLSLKFRPAQIFNEARSILAVHNLLHQGVFELEWINRLGLDFEKANQLMSHSYRNQTKPYINIFKGGLGSADSVVTVSQRYAWEITHPEFGCQMDEMLQKRGNSLYGILNGIDADSWNPATDPHIEKQYSKASDVKQKLACKVALQRELKLSSSPDTPLLGFVGRLDKQKGPDIVLAALPNFVNMGCQVVMLGSGWEDFEARMRHREEEFPEYFRAVVGFSVPLAHRILAGCDALLIPSRFEPCGLSQMHAMRYGTLPIAHATGGLLDTIDSITPFAKDDETDEVSGTGWLYTSNNTSALVDAVERATHIFKDRPKMWQCFRKQAMEKDFGWEQPTFQYEQVLLETLEREQFFG